MDYFNFQSFSWVYTAFNPCSKGPRIDGTATLTEDMGYGLSELNLDKSKYIF